MHEAELFLVFVRPLNQIGVRYMVSGGVAAILYGEPRLTNVVDIVVFLRSTDIRRLAEIFPQNEFYVPPIPVMIEEAGRPANGHFNLIHTETGYKADIYTSGRDELNEWGLRNGRKLEIEGDLVVVAPPEYVIVRKLEYFREGGSEKHLHDIRSMLAISGAAIDRDVLEDWVERRDVREQWDRLAR